MTFADWQQLSPAAAAAELLGRLEQVPSSQRRALIAWSPEPEELERRFAAARPGLPLSGVPCLMKDLFDVAGEPTRGGSVFLEEVRPSPPPGGDGALARDLREAGVVLAGKAQMVEFACGLIGENPHYGDCAHPRFSDRTSGGSSSGSAAAVGRGLVPLAAGSDTGGSVRVPASFCGVYGIRLFPHQSWIADAVPLAPSFDTAGWFTADPGDMQIALRALVPVSPVQREPRGLYLAMPGLDPEVERACEASASRLAPAADARRARGLRNAFEGAGQAYHILSALEMIEAHRPWQEAGRGRYGPAARARLDWGRAFTAAEIAAAHDTWERVARAWEEYFQDFDYLVLPAAPFPSPRPPEFTAEHRRRILELTGPATLGGLPALALPVPLEGAPGLTAGLQLVVRHAGDPLLQSALEQWRS